MAVETRFIWIDIRLTAVITDTSTISSLEGEEETFNITTLVVTFTLVTAAPGATIVTPDSPILGEARIIISTDKPFSATADIS